MTKFTMDYRGVGELLRSPEIEAATVPFAARIKAAAEASAPFDATSRTHYRDSFHIETNRRGGVHHDRAVASVVNTDAAAFFIEYGTSRTPKFRTLGNALLAARA
jgi:hypothetical protein